MFGRKKLYVGDSNLCKITNAAEFDAAMQTRKFQRGMIVFTIIQVVNLMFGRKTIGVSLHRITRTGGCSCGWGGPMF